MRTRSKCLFTKTLSLLLVASLILPGFAIGCGTFLGKGVEIAKEKTAEKVEEKAVKIGVDLKREYAIDLATDTPQAALMKIIRSELKKGNGDLAALLADVEKVDSLQDALQIVATYHQTILDKEKRGEVVKEAKDAAERMAKGAEALAGITTLAGILAWLRGKGFKEAALLLARKIEAKRLEGSPDAEAIVEDVKKDEGTAASVVAGLVRKHLPKTGPRKAERARMVPLAKLQTHP